MLGAMKKYHQTLIALIYILFPLVSPFEAEASVESEALELLVASLTACHPELIAARTRVEIAESNIEQTRANRLPTFSVSAGAYVNDDQTDEGQVALNVTLPIVTFGRQNANEQLAHSQFELAEAQYERTSAQHIERLIESWITRNAILRRIQAFDESIEEKQALIATLENRTERGISSEAELRDAQAQYLSDVAEVENLRLQLIDIETNILSLTCDNDQNNYFTWSSLPIEATSLIIEAHPEYQVREAELFVAEREMDTAHANGNPTLQLEGRAAIDESEEFSSRLGLSMNYEYESFGIGRRAEVTQAELSVREAENLLASLRIELESEVRSNFQRLDQLSGNIIPAYRSELLNLQGALSSSQRLYEAGRVSVRELLSDINGIRESHLNLIDAQEQVWTIYNDIAYASGLYTE